MKFNELEDTDMSRMWEQVINKIKQNKKGTINYE